MQAVCVFGRNTFSMSLTLSPLRYPGSKRRLAVYIAQALQANRLAPALYVEPFVGGASVALYLLQQKAISQVILIDKDPWIASFWETVFWDTNWLIEQIMNTPVTLETWQVLKETTPKTRRKQAWACLFLNRTSFSGILRQEVGPLGGKAQNSPYKVGCRFPRQTLIERISQIASLQERVFAVWEMSWEEGIEQIRKEQGKGNLPQDNVFFYFDPPFFEKAEALYRYYFSQEDHIRLRDALLNLKDKWLLSYDSAEQVEALYGEAIAASTNGAKKSSMEMVYTISKVRERKKGKEVILSNLEILPELNGK
jgi:DNA adenine methylase